MLNAHDDIRESPNYSIPEAARYVGLPRPTVRAWVLGQSYLSGGKTRRFQPVIVPADRTRPALSFFNLVELHVLSALRRQHNLSLQEVRKSLAFLSRWEPLEHPLAHWKFATDGKSLLVESLGNVLNVSREGQMELLGVIEAFLIRIERDKGQLPIRLYPATRSNALDETRGVVIDPRVSFGRPVLNGTGIATAVVAERFKAGETINELAVDYARTRDEIEEALRCEQAAA